MLLPNDCNAINSLKRQQRVEHKLARNFISFSKYSNDNDEGTKIYHTLFVTT